MTLTRGEKLLDNCPMQQLRNVSNGSVSPAGCAAEILEALPEIVRFVRAQMRGQRGTELSVPQFRTLAFLSCNPDVSLSLLAEHLGLSLPRTSRLVDGLVRKNFVGRRVPRANRRVVALSLRARGKKTIGAARKVTEERLAEVVASLGNHERLKIQRALRTLTRIFRSVTSRDGGATVGS